MQIPLLSGIYTDDGPDFRVSYPRNLVPVALAQGISSGYLRIADGITEFGTGPGIDRGGINWNGICYRVMGTKLVSIAADGNTQTLGDVGGSGQVRLDYSFDRLAIASGGKLFYWNGGTLIQVTDPDLGSVLDMVWIDGFFMTTDGTSLVVTELSDPTQVNPLKYGSSEVDPDPVKALLKLRNEVYALNRYTVEVFDNIGGDFFPFGRIDGAQLPRGVIGTHAACIFLDSIAFLGSGRNEAPAIYLGQNANATKISTAEIDRILADYTEAQLSTVVLETRTDRDHQQLLVHLPDQTLAYDGLAAARLQVPAWFVLTTSLTGKAVYQARNLVYCYDKWLCGNPLTSQHGELTQDIATHYGQTIGWEFGTPMVYNEGRGAIFHELELVCLTGRVPLGIDPTVWTSYSTDGEVFSQEQARSAGQQGERNVRMNWLQQGPMQHWRVQKFRGTSDAVLSMAALEARIEGLND
jgi:hypothetical protein